MDKIRFKSSAEWRQTNNLLLVIMNSNLSKETLMGPVGIHQAGRNDKFASISI